MSTSINISLLGSTGSIGTQTLEIARSDSNISVVALSAGYNINLLEEQMREFNPQIVAVFDEEKAKELREKTRDLAIPILSGMEGLLEVARVEGADILVTAIVGMIGIRPTIEGIKSGKDIALANKETLVTAGHIIMPLAKEYGVEIYPVDSEHSAIYQCLQGNTDTKGAKGINKIILTASGGPFRGKTLDDLQHITVEDALRHPNWVMGKKITIDSSTMVNKGLEIIEARWLFDVSFDQIEVIIQPKSIIHSMVEFIDGAVMAQLGTPDMKLPILYAIYRGKRHDLVGDRLDFRTLGLIQFEEPDNQTFIGLPLAFEAGRIGGSMPTVYNATNEKAVSLFLKKKISYLQITELIKNMMGQHTVIGNPSLETILEVEEDTYRKVDELLLN